MIARLQTLPVVELPGGIVAREAHTRRARRKGLARLDGLTSEDALWLPRCRSIHTIGMRCALDLTWLDADGAIVREDRAVRPNRVRTCLRATSVLERPARGMS